MKELNKSTIVKIVALVLVIASYFLIPPVNNFFSQVFKVFASLDVDALKEYILSFGIWAPTVSFFLMILQAVITPLPGFLVTFANASLFGWVKGALLSWTSAMFGAVACFYISRIYGRQVAEKFTTKFALEEVDEFFKKHGNYAVLIARLLPFMSFGLVSYGAGLTSMGLWPYLWATGLGQLPATIVYSYAGEMLTGGVKTFVLGLSILFSVAILMFLIKKVMRDKDKSKDQSKGTAQ